jgi:hypothetical protein
MDIRVELNAIIGEFSDLRDKKIFHARFLDLETKTTLNKLGLEFVLTREGIRLLEGKIRKKLFYARSMFPSSLAAAISHFRRKTGTCTKLEEILELLSEAGFPHRTYSDLDDSCRLFLYYAGPYRVWHEYLVTVKTAEKLGGLPRILWKRLKHGDLTMPEANRLGRRAGVSSPQLIAEILSALQANHFHIYHLAGDRWAYKPQIKDRVVMFLEEAGRPLDIRVLADKCGVAPRPLVDKIKSEPRIVRVDRRTYGLREWGNTPYIGIVDAIHRMLEKSGGRARVADIIDKVAKKYSVSKDSVRQYARFHASFILENGLLHARHEEDVNTEPPGLDLGQVSGCLWINSQPALRMPINNRLWKGSGRGIPRAWAAEAGVKPGEKIFLVSIGCGITLSWLGKQPALGSLRKLAIQDRWPRKGFAFIILSATGLTVKHAPLPPEPSNDPKAVIEAIVNSVCLTR